MEAQGALVYGFEQHSLKNIQLKRERVLKSAPLTLIEQLELYRVQSFLGAGFYKQAYTFFTQIESKHTLSYAVLAVEVYEKVGMYQEALQVIANTKSNVDLREHSIANLKNNEAYILMKRGDYLKTQELMDDGLQYILEYLGKGNLYYADNAYLHAKYYVKQNRVDVALSYYVDAYTRARKRDYPIFYGEYITTREKMYLDFSLLLEVMHQPSYGSKVSKEYLWTVKSGTGKKLFGIAAIISSSRC